MTLQDAAAIGLLVAALIQAGAAILIARLTGSLANSTDQYAKSADRQVVELRAQVAELVQGRLAAVQPYVHVTGARLYDPGVAGNPNFLIMVYLANFGSGPALSVRGQLSHDWFDFPSVEGRELAAGQGTFNSASVDLVLGRPVLTTAQLRPSFPTEFRLTLEYRDLAGQWWTTRVAVRGSPKLGEQWDIAVEDQREQVALIPAPTIPQQLPAGVNTRLGFRLTKGAPARRRGCIRCNPTATPLRDRKAIVSSVKSLAQQWSARTCDGERGR